MYKQYFVYWLTLDSLEYIKHKIENEYKNN